MRLAHANPQALSSRAEQTFFRFRSSAWVQRFETRRLLRRGRIVFRWAGRSGADLPCPPFEWRNYQALLKFQKLLGHISRRPPNSALGVQSRQTKAEARAKPVLSMYSHYQHRGRHAAALIATRLGEPVFYVRRVLRESVRDRKIR